MSQKISLTQIIDLAEEFLVNSSAKIYTAVIHHNSSVMRSMSRQEPIEAFVAICVNLSDSNCPISGHLYDMLKNTGEEFINKGAIHPNLTPQLWETLREQVI